MKNFENEQIRRLILESRSVAITSHHNPDGDAVGSVIALSLLLRKLGKDCLAVVPNDYPAFLKWMPGSNSVTIFKHETDSCRDFIARADLIFCLDYNALHRTVDMENDLRNARGTRILIDQHLEPVISDFSFLYSETATSSTGELVYRFIQMTGFNDLIDHDIAAAIFVGIMTDTGSFSYSCNYPETFDIVARLMAHGISADRIHRLVYDTYSESRLRLLGYCLSEKLVILPDFQTAYIALSKEELHKFNHQVGDTEGVVNYALSIEGVKVAVLMTERKDRIRLSFRSKGTFSVNRMAREHFSGGGHLNAAGGDSFLTLAGTIEKLISVLPQYAGDIRRSEL